MDQHSLGDIVLSLADGVVVIDRMGGVQWSNPAANRLLERSATELSGTNILEVVHTDDIAGNSCGCHSRRRHRGPQDLHDENTLGAPSARPRSRLAPSP